MKINQNTLITFKITKHENYFHNPSTADQYNFNLDNRGKNLLFLRMFYDERQSMRNMLQSMQI